MQQRTYNNKKRKQHQKTDQSNRKEKGDQQINCTTLLLHSLVFIVGSWQSRVQNSTTQLNVCKKTKGKTIAYNRHHPAFALLMDNTKIEKQHEYIVEMRKNNAGECYVHGEKESRLHSKRF